MFNEPGYVALRLRFPRKDDEIVEDFEQLTAEEKAQFAHAQRTFPEAKIIVLIEPVDGHVTLIETPEPLIKTEMVILDDPE